MADEEQVDAAGGCEHIKDTFCQGYIKGLVVPERSTGEAKAAQRIWKVETKTRLENKQR